MPYDPASWSRTQLFAVEGFSEDVISSGSVGGAGGCASDGMAAGLGWEGWYQVW